MKKFNRRNFLQVAGASSAVAAGAILPSAGLLAGSAASANVMTFRAVAGMPKQPLPSYASLVIEGHVDLAAHTGVITRSLFAGAPALMSGIALPGMSRIARITAVEELGSSLRLTGVVDDRSQLQRGESPMFSVLIDRSSGIVTSDLLGTSVSLALQR